MSGLRDIAVVTNPHHVRLGGHEAVVRLVDAFYAAMDVRADARSIRAMHGADLSHTKAVLVTYLDEWLGGPKRYTEQRGTPRLGRVHAPFALDAAAADAWLACMAQALEETCADAALRGELLAGFTKVARHLQGGHNHHHRSP
jgi:hemoglobin